MHLAFFLYNTKDKASETLLNLKAGSLVSPSSGYSDRLLLLPSESDFTLYSRLKGALISLVLLINLTFVVFILC